MKMVFCLSAFKIRIFLIDNIFEVSEKGIKKAPATWVAGALRKLMILFYTIIDDSNGFFYVNIFLKRFQEIFVTGKLCSITA